MDNTQSQVLVVGGTIAGMTAAIAAAESGAHVTIVSSIPLIRSSDVTLGDGIAAVLQPEAYNDSVEQHVRDIVSAGCDEQRARQLRERAPVFVRFLARAGVLFNRTTEGHLEQTQTAGHTKPRTVRVDDVTGQHVVRVLEEQVRRCEAKGMVERKEYFVPLSFVFDEENSCRGLVVMERANHACTALKADAIIMTIDGYTGLYGEARNTPCGLVIDNDHMTTLQGLFAAGGCACGMQALSGNIIAAYLVGGADAGESACSYVADLATHADELGASLFERVCDREEKYHKELLDRTEGENPYVLADELNTVMEKWTSGERDVEVLENLVARVEKMQLPDSSQWWNDSLVFARDLENQITLARMVVRDGL